MLLENKNAIIYGAGGAVGSAAARAFAREGAHVFLTGRNPDTLESIAKEITAAGGAAESGTPHDRSGARRGPDAHRRGVRAARQGPWDLAGRVRASHGGHDAPETYDHVGGAGEAAAFLASDRAAALTGTVANLTGGAIVD